jgi:DNA-binding transcriptional MerR regulator
MSEIPSAAHAPSTYPIDELARLGATTVRNIRAYQERGILPPPVRQGRVGIYNDTHLAQLRIISRLLGRGYSIANISELFDAQARGQTLNHLIGIDTALTSQWVAQTPTLHHLDELLAQLPTLPTAEELTLAFNLGILEPAAHQHVRLNNPVLIQLAIHFMHQGFQLMPLLQLMQHILPNFQVIAEQLAEVSVQLALGTHQPATIRGPEYTEQMIELIWNLRPMVVDMIQQQVAHALSTSLRRRMTDQLIETMTTPHPSARHD